jgi:hypothetical protein
MDYTNSAYRIVLQPGMSEVCTRQDGGFFGDVFLKLPGQGGSTGLLVVKI